MRYSDPAKVMEALEADKKQVEEQFTIVNGDIEKLKEKEVLRKFFFFINISKDQVCLLAEVSVEQQIHSLSSNHLHIECINYMSLATIS